jgi:hypothetical protein
LRAVGVELRDENAPHRSPRDLVDGGRHRLAGAAPVGVEVHQHRDVGARHRALERVVIEPHRPVEQHRLAALAAFGSVRRARGVDAVPGVAELAADRRVLGRRGRRGHRRLPPEFAGC